MNLKNLVAKALAEHCSLSAADIESLFETPPNEEMGDLAFPCFRLAKELKKAPVMIAKDLAGALEGQCPSIKAVAANGPYVNFFFDRAAFAAELFDSVNKAEGGFAGMEKPGLNQTVLIDYSSPNIAKPFHVGHGFSTFLGESIAKIYDYLGYRVVRLNHLGDYGTQFGKLISGWKRWGDAKALEENPIQELTRVYVKFHAEMETHPELEEEGRESFRRLEAGEPEEHQLWSKFLEVSLKEFNRLYKRLNISFDNYNGESFYTDKIPAVLDELREKGLLELSEGAQVVNLDDYNLNPCLIIKSNGTTTYASRDIASIFYRDKTWNFDRNIYVVGQEQINHFNQVFAVLERMGFPKARQNVHVSFGRIKVADGSFSTRKGTVILLEELLNQTVAKTLSIIRENNQDMSEEEMQEIAETVGVDAVKYTYMKSGREKDILFDWDDMLDFDGDTAPYMLYTYARAKSILRKSGKEGSELDDADISLLTGNEEFTLLKDIAGLQDAVQAAADSYEPCLLVRQLISVARSFNRYYHNVSILKSENEALSLARLALCRLMAEQISFGLSLLGIKTVERM